jgi:hypothetical protein
LVAGTWKRITPASLDTNAFPCSDIQFAPSNPSTLIAVHGAGGGLWKSTDAGVNWVQIGDLPMPNSLGRVLIDPKNEKHLYYVGSVGNASMGFWISQDGGNTWKIPKAFSDGAGKIWSSDVYGIVADPTDFNHIVMTFHYPWPNIEPAAGILESLDGGVSFIPHNPPPGMDHAQGVAFLYNPALGIGNKNTWLVGAGYGGGLFRTTDAGATWKSVSTLQQNHGGFDAHYSSSGNIYIGSTSGLHRSRDNGATWTQITQGLGSNYIYGAIGDGNYLYTSYDFVSLPMNQPFFVSPEGGSDEGTVWTPYSKQTLVEGAFKMTFEPASRTIYSANWSQGAWALKVTP